MHRINYFVKKENADNLTEKGVKGAMHFEKLDEVLDKINKEWQIFDSQLIKDGQYKLAYFQNPSNYCLARICLERGISEKEEKAIFSIGFSFIEKAVLTETAKSLGLPLVESDISEE